MMSSILRCNEFLMNVCDGVCLLHDELELDIIGFKLMSKRSSENE